MAKLAERFRGNTLLVYCVAFGVVFGMTLGFSIGSLISNSRIGPMGAAIGVFIGLAAWVILSNETDF